MHPFDGERVRGIRDQWTSRVSQRRVVWRPVKGGAKDLPEKNRTYGGDDDDDDDDDDTLMQILNWVAGTAKWTGFK